MINAVIFLCIQQHKAVSVWGFTGNQMIKVNTAKKAENRFSARSRTIEMLTYEKYIKIN